MERTESIIPFLDAHTHRSRQPEGVLALRNLNYPEEPVPDASARPLCSAGVHPYEAGRRRLEDLEPFLRKHSCAAVGECGLDRRAGPSLEIQTACFLEQAELAERLNLPVVVHCVRAYPELIALRKRHHFSVPWIVHGFRGKEEAAAELMRHGMTLSLSPVWLLHSASLYDSLREVPFLLETDDGAEDIREIYSAAARLLKWETAELKERIFLNFQSIFPTGVKL